MSSSVQGKLTGTVIGKYKLSTQIGSGSFGTIYLGRNIKTDEEVAIKVESSQIKHPQLFYEAKLYKILSGGDGIPRVRYFERASDYSFLVMDLLGPSLQDLYMYCSKHFSLKTVLMLAFQMIFRVEYIHSRSFLHRDIKPDNFLMGVGRNSYKVYMVDLGLAKKYQCPRTKEHISYRDGKNLTGTARYASINTHIGIEQSRRDDLEALGYVLMYFLRGGLPWEGLRANTKRQKYEKIKDKKMATSPQLLCMGFPDEFAVYLNYCQKLGFDETPDYAYLRQLFLNLFAERKFSMDYIYDWSRRAISSF
ncbi:unnamed protein product [Hymenolepis diminuta]|uniref:non-specific serine/threonine protein kinase n=1 Tax=Hymenolepis diminuta TaxID=6216 RepID=A0A564YVD4_HYMDI|nr:unnamed protein product [Hymenolepis diminuta]